MKLLSNREMTLLKMLLGKGYFFTSIERGLIRDEEFIPGDTEFQLVLEGERNSYRFQADFRLCCINNLVNWTRPEVARLCDYPDMAAQGDWSSIRDSSWQALEQIFVNFVLPLADTK
jgi:hypothetical protein